PTRARRAQDGYGGAQDGLVTAFNAAGTGLAYSTYLGGGSADAARGVAVTGGGYAAATGLTASSTFPTTSGAFQSSYGGGSNDALPTRPAPARALSRSRAPGRPPGRPGTRGPRG